MKWKKKSTYLVKRLLQFDHVPESEQLLF